MKPVARSESSSKMSAAVLSIHRAQRPLPKPAILYLRRRRIAANPATSDDKAMNAAAQPESVDTATVDVVAPPQLGTESCRRPWSRFRQKPTRGRSTVLSDCGPLSEIHDRDEAAGVDHATGNRTKQRVREHSLKPVARGRLPSRRLQRRAWEAAARNRAEGFISHGAI